MAWFIALSLVKKGLLLVVLLKKQHLHDARSD